MNPKKIIKVLISIVIFATIISFVDFAKLYEHFKLIELKFYLLIILGYFIGQVLSAFKWSLILKESNINQSFRKVLESYFTGMFINSFALGIVGGDLARSLLVANKKNKTESFFTVVADRVHGLAILVFLGALSVIFFDTKLDPRFIGLLIFLAISVLIFWFFGPKILLKIVNPENKFYNKIQATLKAFPHNPKVLLQISIISVIFHFIQISMHYIIGIALNIEIPLYILFATIPFVNILTSLPFSWNGLGVREAGYIFFLSFILTNEQCVLFGAIWLLAVSVNSLLGGVIAVLSGSMEFLNKNKEI